MVLSPSRTPAKTTDITGKKLPPNQSAILTLDLPPSAERTPTISPELMRIGLGAGGRRTVPYTLALPGSRKVDVYFLVDISASMKDKIRGVKMSLNKIVSDLQQAGVDPWFGVGEYRSYTEGPAYARVLDVSPAGRPLLEALSGLVAAGGGQETQLAALYQAAKGTGNADPNAFIASGQQVHFRPDALRLVLHVSDEGFDATADQPTFEQVGAAMRAEKALQIGLAYEPESLEDQLLTNPTFTPGPRIGMARVARLTGALAPSQGADCDGDGTANLLPGEPLVCIVDPKKAGDVSAIAAAIVNVVLAAPDIAPASLTWTAPKKVVGAINPSSAPAVNLRFPARLTFNVTYTCPRDLAPGAYQALLTARLRTTQIAQARAVIDCTAGAAPALVAPAIATGVGTTIGPPTEPVTNANPQSQPQGQPQSQPQSQAQGQAQAGAVHQEQENPQFAFAYTNTVGDGERVLSFTRYRASPAAEPGLGLVAAEAAAFTVAVLTAARLRRRRQLARAYRRTPNGPAR